MAQRDRNAEIAAVKALNFNGVKGDKYGSTVAGGAWKVQHTTRFISAVSKPEVYLANRVKAIEEVNTQLDTEFATKYSNWIAQGCTPADALARTETYILKLSEALNEEVDLMWPEDIQATAANMSYNKSALGKNGVDPQVAKARGRGKK